MSEKITTAIPIEFIGESPAVKDLEGNLITSKDEIEVECLPGDLISEIKVDISALKTFDDMIHVKSLNLASTIEVLDDPEDIIAQVTPPRSEEELEQMETEAATDQEKEQIEKIEAEAEAGKETKEGEEEGTAKEESKSEENK
jgi:large subunit ribosomal protein L25